MLADSRLARGESVVELIDCAAVVKTASALDVAAAIEVCTDETAVTLPISALTNPAINILASESDPVELEV